jgi:hypothetical protein
LRLCAAEVEADLLFKGIDIHDWHTRRLNEDGLPVLSSRRLLILLDRLPDDSEFKKFCRGGDWSEAQYLVAGQLNELRLLRTDQAAISGREMSTNLVESPAQIEARQAEQDRQARLRRKILKQLNSGRKMVAING